MSSIGARVFELRKKRKLSQRNLALKTGLTHSTIGRIERDEVVPEGKTLETLSKFFGVSFEYLLNGVDSETSVSNPQLDDFHFALFNKTKDITSEELKNDILNVIDALKKGKI